MIFTVNIVGTHSVLLQLSKALIILCRAPYTAKVVHVYQVQQLLRRFGLMSASLITAQTDRQTDRHTHGQTE